MGRDSYGGYGYSPRRYRHFETFKEAEKAWWWADQNCYGSRYHQHCIDECNRLWREENPPRRIDYSELDQF